MLYRIVNRFIELIDDINLVFDTKISLSAIVLQISFLYTELAAILENVTFNMGLNI
jgi:hypothetical protein